MKRTTLALFVWLLLVAPVLGACSETPEATRGPGPAPVLDDRQEAAFSLSAEPDTLDPALAGEPESFLILGNVMEGLLRYGPDGRLVPAAAAEWSVSEGVHYTFVLRPHVRWADGSPLTAADFRFAWLRALDPATAGPYAYQLFYIRGAEAFNTLNPTDSDFEDRRAELREQVAIEAPDDRTLKVTLERPVPYFPSLTAFPAYYPVPQETVEKHGSLFGTETATFVGNGPFVLTYWSHTEKIELKRNQEYWDANAVKLEKATFTIVHDPEEPARLFATGKLDRAPLTAAALPGYLRNQQLQHLPEAVTWYVAANTRREPLSNPALRKILSLAVDRQSFAKEVLGGAAVPAAGLVPPTVAGWEGKVYREHAGPFLEAESSQTELRPLWQGYLSESGVSGLTLRMATLNIPTAKRYAMGLQKRWQTVLPGLSIELEYMDRRTMMDRLKAGEYELAYTGIGADYDDPMTFLELWLTASPYNDSGWSNGEYDQALRGAREEPDPALRGLAMARAEAILMQELPAIPLYHPAAWWVEQPWLKGVRNRPFGPAMDLKHAYIEGRS